MSYAPVPGPYPAAPPRAVPTKRVSAWWWVAGGGLIVAAIASFVLFLVLLIVTIHDVVNDPLNNSFRADGSSNAVTLPSDTLGYVWIDTPSAARIRCAVTDARTGESLPLRTPSGRIDYDEWNGLFSFPTGSGELKVSCRGDELADVMVGPAPHLGRIVTFGVLMFVVPGILGLVGVVVLIVTIVRAASRPKAPPPYGYGYPSPWPAPPQQPAPPPHQPGPPPAHDSD